MDEATDHPSAASVKIFLKMRSVPQSRLTDLHPHNG
jgi:hypothetical protein